MAAVPDETLMAYADGELDGTERASVEVILKQDAESRARLEIFMRTGRQVVGAQFDGLLREPVPRHLIDTINTAAAAPRRRIAATQPAAGLGERLAALLARVLPSWPTAAAFTASIAIAAGAGWSLKSMTPQGHEPASQTPGHQASAPHVGIGGNVASKVTVPAQLVAIKSNRIEAGGVLVRALEATPSYMPTEAASDGSEQPASVMLRLSYRNPANSFCRQYVVRLPTGEGFAGIGCRNADGSWQVQSHIAIGSIAKLSVQKTSLASVATPPEIATVIERTGHTLSDLEEKAALAGHWQSQPH